MTSILLIDDDQDLGSLLSNSLRASGFRAKLLGSKGLVTASIDRPDLMVINAVLGWGSGFDLCRRMRHSNLAGIPILLMSPRDALDGLGAALDAGANDFLGRPFSVQELIARCGTLVSGDGTDTKPRSYSFDDIEVDLLSHRVRRKGRDVHVGPTEYALIEMFLREPSHVFTREEIIARLWPTSDDRDERNVDVAIGRLRKALNRDGARNAVRTIRGVGYGLG